MCDIVGFSVSYDTAGLSIMSHPVTPNILDGKGLMLASDRRFCLAQ
jgi:hypothetical protein